MKEDDVMKEAPPLEVDSEDDDESVSSVLPDKDKVLEVVRCTKLRGTRQRVKIHLKVFITKTQKRDSYYSRIKTAFEQLFANKDMELSLVVKDRSRKIHSMTDFPETLKDFNEVVDLRQDDDSFYQAYLHMDTNYMPNEIINRNAEAKKIISPLKLSLLAFHMTPHKTIMMGYLLFAHCKYTALTSRTAEIETYLEIEYGEEIMIELSRATKMWGDEERFETNLIKIRCERRHVNVVRNAISKMTQEGYLPPKYQFLPFGPVGMTDIAFRNNLQDSTRYLNSVAIIRLQDVNVEDLYDYLSKVENGETKLKSLYRNVEFLHSITKVGAVSPK